MNRSRPIARLIQAMAVLGIALWMHSSVKAYPYFYGSCNLSLYQGGYGACANDVDGFDAGTFSDCGSSCECYCGAFLDYMMGHNGCSAIYGGSCSLSGDYCAGAYENCDGIPGQVCCDDWFVCGNENYRIPAIRPTAEGQTRLK